MNVIFTDLYSIGKFIFDFIVFFMLGPGVLIYAFYKIIVRGSLRRFFLYEKRDSIVHRLDPRAKILWAITLTTLAAVLEDIYVLLGLFLWSVLMWILAKPPKEKLITAFVMLLPIPVNAIFYQGIRYGYDFWHHTFIYPVTPVYVMHPALDYILGGHIITVEGMLYGAFQSLRILVAASTGLLLAVTTAPNALLLGLSDFVRIKDKHIGLPYVISFAVVIGIRLIPTMFEDANIVINAARVRGLTLQVVKSRNPIKVAKALGRAIHYFLYMIVPLIVSSLRRGSRMAIAADLRAFRAKPYRTYLIERKFSKLDWAFTLITLTVWVLGWVYAYMGGAATPGFIL